MNRTSLKRINALFRQFGNNGQKEDKDMESVEGNTNEVEIGEHISEEQYEHYVGQRKSFGGQARSEAVAHYYPTKSPAILTEEEWSKIQPHINARFRELLVTAFPDNHLQMNILYENRKT